LSQIEKAALGPHLATAGGFAAVLLWSLTVAFARSLSEQLGAVTAGVAVYSVSGVIALAFLLRSRERRGRIRQLPNKYLIGCGTLFVGYMLLLFLAVGLAQHRPQVLEVALLNYLWPALTLLFSLVLLGRKARLILLPGTFLALLGVFLVLTHGTGVSWQSFLQNLSINPVAYLLGLGAAVSWALYSALTRKWAGGQAAGAVDLFLPVTAGVLILVSLFVDEPRGWGLRSITEALLLGVATYLAYGLWDTAMRGGNVVLVAASSYLTPFFSTVVSCLYLAVVPESRLWIGCGMLIAGSALSWYSISDSVPVASATAYPHKPRR
jgi:drug/metabolite transporter (DMT)-like permease